MTSHKDHSHPATKLARRLCRAGVLKPVHYPLTLTDRPFVQLVGSTITKRSSAIVLGAARLTRFGYSFSPLHPTAAQAA